MNKLYALFTAAVAVLMVSCGHTNELEHYSLDSKAVLFEQEVAGDISSVSIRYSDEVKLSDKDEKKGNSTLETLGDIAGSVGTAILSSKTQEKLNNATNPEKVVTAVSGGVENTMERYLRTHSASIDNAEFIVVTRLDDVALVSWSGGIALKVVATTAISERGSGALIWENCESHSVPLRRYLSAAAATGLDKTLADVGQAIILANVSEAELAQAIDGAAGEVGRLMAETLREDIADARAQ